VHRGSSVFSSSCFLFCFSRCKLAIREYCCEACEKQDVAEVTMRGLHFELESGQQRRVSKAQERLKDAAGSVHAAAFVNVGDTIQVDHEAGFLRGHGTQVVNGELLATVCGIVERVNKLVSVRPLRAKYLSLSLSVYICLCLCLCLSVCFFNASHIKHSGN
jgi:hypothetical protein